jgi:hypothetical protein
LIVIGSSPGREHWLKDCINSLRLPCLTISDSKYELSKIAWCAKHLGKKFFFFQDSVVFKSTRWISELLEKDKSIALTSDPVPYGTYMGIYDPEILRRIEIPIPNSKQEAIDYELTWTETYIKEAKDYEIAFPDFSDAKAKKKVFKHGRENLVLENDYLIKYKGNWGQKPALD